MGEHSTHLAIASSIATFLVVAFTPPVWIFSPVVSVSLVAAVVVACCLVDGLPAFVGVVCAVIFHGVVTAGIDTGFVSTLLWVAGLGLATLAFRGWTHDQHDSVRPWSFTRFTFTAFVAAMTAGVLAGWADVVFERLPFFVAAVRVPWTTTIVVVLGYPLSLGIRRFRLVSLNPRTDTQSPYLFALVLFVVLIFETAVSVALGIVESVPSETLMKYVWSPLVVHKDLLFEVGVILQLSVGFVVVLAIARVLRLIGSPHDTVSDD